MKPNDDTPLLEVREVTRRFGALVAVDKVSFKIQKGEIFGIAGPNGSGKSTLFNIITGIPFPPSEGEVLLSGKSINRLKPHEISRAGVLRTFAEFATLSARENAYKRGILRADDFIRRARRFRAGARRCVVGGRTTDESRFRPLGVRTQAVDDRLCPRWQA